MGYPQPLYCRWPGSTALGIMWFPGRQSLDQPERRSVSWEFPPAAAELAVLAVPGYGDD